MKIVTIYGSPDKKGNTATIVDEILKGAAESGHTFEKFYLRDEEVNFCLACENAYQIHREKYCTHNDDFRNKITPAIIEADILIFASPVYMGHITGNLKTVFDRFYTFLEEKFNVRYLPGKKFITVVTSGAPQDVFQKVSEYLDNWLANFFKMEKIAQIHEGDMMASDTAANYADLLNRAKEIGRNLK